MRRRTRRPRREAFRVHQALKQKGNEQFKAGKMKEYVVLVASESTRWLLIYREYPSLKSHQNVLAGRYARNMVEKLVEKLHERGEDGGDETMYGRKSRSRSRRSSVDGRRRSGLKLVGA